MRQFAMGHGTVWLAHWRDGRLGLDYVGDVEANATFSLEDLLATFDGGALVESTSVEQTSSGSWAVAIEWVASRPLDAQIFAHVRVAEGNLVVQADGPALGGTVLPGSGSAGTVSTTSDASSPPGPLPTWCRWAC